MRKDIVYSIYGDGTRPYSKIVLRLWPWDKDVNYYDEAGNIINDSYPFFWWYVRLQILKHIIWPITVDYYGNIRKGWRSRVHDWLYTSRNR